MTSGPIHRQALVDAITWAGEQLAAGETDRLKVFSKAATRFDLSPLEVEFLNRHFVVVE